MVAGQPTSLPTSMLGAASRAAGADSLADRAYEAIRDLIVSLELPPATFVDERALAERIGVGLTPVRQALRRLAWESLVVILPRRGTLVADINADDLAKIFEMRVELEGLAAAGAATRASAAERDALHALLARTEAAIAADPADHRALIALDRDLHLSIARAARNELLERTVTWLYHHVLRVWNVSLTRVEALPGSVEGHVGIVAAIDARDPDLARDRMRDHIRRFHDAFSSAAAA